MKIMTAVVFALLLFLCGCCSTAPERGKDVVSPEEKGVLLLRAIGDKDFSQYERMAGERAEPGAEEDFLRSCEVLEREFGTMGRITFLKNLRIPLFFSQLFSVEFRRTNAEGKEICRELLFQLLWENASADKLLGITPR